MTWRAHISLRIESRWSIGQMVIVTGNKEQTLNYPDPRVRQFVRGELTGPLTADA